MSSKGKGLKNRALAAVRITLKKNNFPDDLQLRPGRKRAEGVGYIASGLVDGTMTRLARLRYNPETDVATLEEDFRSACGDTPIIGPHADPAKVEREAMWPSIQAMVADKLADVFVGWSKPDQSWRIEHTARLHVKDARGMRHIVRCVIVDKATKKDQIRRTLHDTEIYHTCIIIWHKNPNRVVDQIVRDVRNWRQGSWPKPK